MESSPAIDYISLLIKLGFLKLDSSTSRNDGSSIRIPRSVIEYSFRQACKALHPDKQKQPAASDEFKVLTHLRDHCMNRCNNTEEYFMIPLPSDASVDIKSPTISSPYYKHYQYEGNVSSSSNFTVNPATLRRRIPCVKGCGTFVFVDAMIYHKCINGRISCEKCHLFIASENLPLHRLICPLAEENLDAHVKEVRNSSRNPISTVNVAVDPMLHSSSVVQHPVESHSNQILAIPLLQGPGKEVTTVPTICYLSHKGPFRNVYERGKSCLTCRACGLEVSLSL